MAAAAALCFAAGLAGAQDVKTDFDKDANFAAIKTFDVKIGTSWKNELSEKRIVGQVTQALTGKGWTRNEQNPDALVVLHGATDVQKSLDTFYTGGYYGGYGYRGWGGMGMGMGSSTTTVREYAVGTLVVDIFDAKSKNLLFRGTASDELSDKVEKNQKKAAKAFEKMFKKFPPGSETKKK
jgi:hypothetical protein